MGILKEIAIILLLLGILLLVATCVATTLTDTIQIPVGEMFAVSPITTIIGLLSIGMLSALSGIAAATGIAYWLKLYE